MKICWFVLMNQMAAAAAASFSFMVMGMVRGWSSPGMPDLLKSKDVALTDDDVSWISTYLLFSSSYFLFIMHNVCLIINCNFGWISVAIYLYR